MSTKDRLKSSLVKGPAVRPVSAHQQLVPDLSSDDIDTSTRTSGGISTNPSNCASTLSDDVHGIDSHETVVKIQLEMVRKDLEAAEEERDRLKAQVEQSETRLRESLEEMRGLLTEVQGYRNEAERERTRADRLESVLSDSQARVQLLEREAASHEEALSELRRDLETAYSTRQTLETQVRTVDEELSQIRAELLRSESAREALEIELRETLSRMEQLMTSSESTAVSPLEILENFGRARVSRQFGMKKTDTYRQHSYYQDHDITDRLKKFMDDISGRTFDKSFIINSVLDHFLRLGGY